MSHVDRERPDQLLAELSHSDEEVRRLAVERLTTLPASEAIPALIEQLADPSWRVRKAAIERLSAAPETSGALPALVGALADGENSGRRNAALETLTRCGSSALPVLFEASGDPDADVRKQAVDALAGIGDPAAVPRLMEVIADPDPNVRGAGAEALGCVGDDRCCDALLGLLTDDPEVLVRLSALRALDRLQVGAPLDALGAILDDALLRAAAYAVLSHNDDVASSRALLKGLEIGGRSAREAALQGLVRICARPGVDGEAIAGEVSQAIGPESAPFAFAVERLREGDLPVRLAAVQLLGLLGHAEAVVPLLGAACDEALTEVVFAALGQVGAAAVQPVDAVFDDLSPVERRMACRMLGETPVAEGRGLLLRALADPDHEVRASAAQALGEHGTLEPVAALVSLLSAAAREGGEWRSDEVDASASALEAIGAEHPSPVIDALVAVLADELEALRVVATRVVSAIGGRGELELLTRLARDPSPAVRRAAVEGTAAVTDEPPLETLRMALADEDLSVRIGAARALAASPDPSVVSDLAHLTDDPDERARAAALAALARWCAEHGDEGSRERVLELVAGALPRGGTPAMAGLEALDGIGGRRAASLAASLLGADDPELAEAAVACVGRHAEAEALDQLLPCLGHAHWSVRAQAVDVLAERRYGTAVPAILRRLESETDEFVRDSILTALDRLE